MKSENQNVMLTNESLDWEERAWVNTCLICPVCNYEYVALQRVEVVAPGMPEGKLTVDSKGIHCVPKKS